MSYQLIVAVFGKWLDVTGPNAVVCTPNQPDPHPTIAAYLVLFLASLLLGVASTPAVRWLALRSGVVNAPSARNIHLSPVPLLGGLAIYFACMVALIGFSPSAYTHLCAAASGYFGWSIIYFFLWLAGRQMGSASLDGA